MLLDTKINMKTLEQNCNQKRHTQAPSTDPHADRENLFKTHTQTHVHMLLKIVRNLNIIVEI